WVPMKDPANRQSWFGGSPQSLVGDLIRDGVTGVSGNVAEPFLQAVVRPQVLFPAYLAGFNLAEAFYLATPYLSWQTVILGDPLCSPFNREPLTSQSRAPETDPETELPQFFSTRRRAVLTSFGVQEDLANLLLKANVRLLRGDSAAARE